MIGAVGRTSGDRPDGALAAPLALARALVRRGVPVSLVGATGDLPRDGVARVARVDRDGVAIYGADDPLAALPALVAADESTALLLFAAPGGLLVRATRRCAVPRFVWVTAGITDLPPEPPEPGCTPIAGGVAVAAALEAWTGDRAPVLAMPVPPVDPAPPDRHVLFIDPRPAGGVEILFALATAHPTVRFAVLETVSLPDAWREHCFRRARHCGNLDWHAVGADPLPLVASARLLIQPALERDAAAWPIGLAQGAGVPALASDQPGLVDAMGAGGRVVPTEAGAEGWLSGFSALWSDGPVRAAALASVRAHAATHTPDRVAARLLEHVTASTAVA